ncbi:MAG TPA: RNA 2',3'-cyclic phosphodiesterase [Anaerolineae bacterium]|nr:RNA 2',3'-cyclic phosphodiesterase [Anaerolineae bacterium]
MSNQSARLFIAIPLPSATTQALATIQSTLDNQLPPKTIRWQNTDKAHLTLFFLGPLSPDQIATIKTALTPIPTQHQPFTLTTTTLGGFPHLKKPNVLWLGLAPTPPLQNLYNQITTTLAPLGLTPDHPTYNPHITLGRRNRQASRQKIKTIAPAIDNMTLPPIPPIPVNQFHLYRSHQAQYDILATYTLNATP